MSQIKRLRIFAGPNGSGKSTLFKNFQKKFNTGPFINADEISYALDKYGSFDLATIGLHCTSEEFHHFLNSSTAKSLISTAEIAGQRIQIELHNNILSSPIDISHGYEGALCTSFIRKQLLKHGGEF